MKQVLPSLLKKLSKARSSLEKQLKIIRKRCKHRDAVELPYSKFWDSAVPPRRICKKCGVEEQGWGAGYQVIPWDHVPMVDEEAFNKFRMEDIEEWGWCYGDREHLGHGVPVDELVCGDGTRCEKHG